MPKLGRLGPEDAVASGSSRIFAREIEVLTDPGLSREPVSNPLPLMLNPNDPGFVVGELFMLVWNETLASLVERDAGWFVPRLWTDKEAMPDPEPDIGGLPLFVWGKSDAPFDLLGNPSKDENSNWVGGKVKGIAGFRIPESQCCNYTPIE